MAVTRTASQCPPVQVASGFRSIKTSGLTGGGSAPNTEGFNTGDKYEARRKMNEIALRLDMTQRASATPIYGIVDGLAITYQPGSGTGGTVTVTKGHAVAVGIMELPADASAIPAQSGWNYYYLTANEGTTPTVEYVNGSLNVPNTPTGKRAVFIGAVNVSGSSGTVDTSGVVYCDGGTPHRQTADAGAPSDTPPLGGSLETRTNGGLYYWDGSGAGYASVGVTAPRSFTVATSMTVTPTDPVEEFYWLYPASNNGTLTLTIMAGTNSAGKRITIKNGVYSSTDANRYAANATILAIQGTSGNDPETTTTYYGGDTIVIEIFAYPDGVLRASIVSIRRAAAKNGTISINTPDGTKHIVFQSGIFTSTDLPTA